jgi:CHAT domain-containing protein
LSEKQAFSDLLQPLPVCPAGEAVPRLEVRNGRPSPFIARGLVSLLGKKTNPANLRKMNLAVLSACETGPGESAGGEGVYGLVRAFHIAGTRNVAASLWKVEDEATAALMVLFYRHLWSRKPLPPVEALRQAQLALYRNPQHVKEWSAGRGPNLKIVLPGSSTKEPDKPPTGKRAPAKTWAAFVLSGD